MTAAPREPAVTDEPNLHLPSCAWPGMPNLGAGEDDSASMTADLARLPGQLAAHPFRGLEVITRRFAHRDHYNVVPGAFAAGLNALFGG